MRVAGHKRSGARAITIDTSVKDRAGADTLANMLDYSGNPGSRTGNSAARRAPISQTTAFKNSVWWAGLSLWADLFSFFPLCVRRPGADGLWSPVTNPGPMFTQPFTNVDITEFQYSVRMDLGRYGNAVGLIRARNSFGVATSVELVPMDVATAQMNGRQIKQWKIDGQYYSPDDVWHQKENTLPGMALGMSTLASAASTMGIYQSAQDFALDWFMLGTNPRGVLKNVVREKVPAEVRNDVKEGFRNATSGGDIFVTGREWEWSPQAADEMSSNFLTQQAASDRDVCRFVKVPASMIDVEVSTGNITYANVTQANLQWLISRVGPAARRVENYWTQHATPSPWAVDVDTDSLLEMDPVTRQTMFGAQVGNFLRVPSEIRALDNLPPFTPDQLAEMELVARLRKPPPLGTPTDPSDPIVAPPVTGTEGI